MARCDYHSQPFLNSKYQCPEEDPEKLVPYNGGHLCKVHRREHGLGRLIGAIFTPKELNEDGSVKLWRLESLVSSNPRIDLGGS